jgi:2-deoxy-D-gluconate 3-dehydrogenase
MKDMFSLQGKVAIVTGGNGGLGKGMARGLAATGASIVIAARNQTKTAQAVKELKQEFGVKAVGITLDVLDPESVRQMATKTLETFGRIDILVNNAGMNIRKLPQDYKLEEWQLILRTNLDSALLCSQAVYPAMKAGGGGKIINIGSMTSIFGGAKIAAYSASKGGVVQLTKCLAVAWAKDNIQVNAIMPGFFDTDLTRQGRRDMPGLEESVLSRTPAGHWGKPDELAGTAAFLASRASDYLTGAAIPVDGGYSITLM